MESIDALGRRPERLAAFTGSLLSEDEDVELQAIVAEAARDLSTPIALVNFVLEQVQFFKAHHGLPRDLAAARGTDRNVSFCQFVVRDGKPFEVEDAEKDDRVPKHLVRSYGIRSYLGMPIKVDGTTVGSLCVIDTKPRQFSEKDRDNLNRLASLVNSRLTLLSHRKDQPGNKQMGRMRKENTGDSIREIRQSIELIKQEILPGKSAATAIEVFLRLMEYNAEHGDIPGIVIDQTLGSAREALADCKEALKNIEISVDQAMVWSSILERLHQLEDRAILRSIMERVQELLGPQLKRIGGFQLDSIPAELEVGTDQQSAVAFLTGAFLMLCNRLSADGQITGINLFSDTDQEKVGLLVQTTLTTADHADLAAKITEVLGDDSAITTGHEDRGLLFQFPG